MDMVDDVLSVMDKYIERKESSYLDRNSLGTFKLSFFSFRRKLKKSGEGVMAHSYTHALIITNISLLTGTSTELWKKRLNFRQHYRLLGYRITQFILFDWELEANQTWVFFIFLKFRAEIELQASAGQNHDPCQTRHRSALNDSVQLKLQFPISISIWNRLFHFARNRTRSHKRIHSTRPRIFHSVKLIAKWRFDWWRHFNYYFYYDIISIDDSHFLNRYLLIVSLNCHLKMFEINLASLCT